MNVPPDYETDPKANGNGAEPAAVAPLKPPRRRRTSAQIAADAAAGAAELARQVVPPSSGAQTHVAEVVSVVPVVDEQAAPAPLVARKTTRRRKADAALPVEPSAVLDVQSAAAHTPQAVSSPNEYPASAAGLDENLVALATPAQAVNQAHFDDHEAVSAPALNGAHGLVQTEGEAAQAHAAAVEFGNMLDGDEDEPDDASTGTSRPLFSVGPEVSMPDVGVRFEQVLSGEFDVLGGPDELPEDIAEDKRVLLPEPEAPKLHKVLAQSGIGSRRHMEQMIHQGQVTVNGDVAHIGQRISFGDVIKLNGRPIKLRIVPPPPRIIAYHKPVGEVVTLDDPQQRPTVFRNLPCLRANGNQLGV
jgi:23S rRNA pseudouridine2605 synthase